MAISIRSKAMAITIALVFQMISYLVPVKID